MKKHYIIKTVTLFALLVFAGKISAQGWTVNANDYANSGTITATVSLNSTEFTSGTLGAFVGEECRGVESVIQFFPPSGHYLLTLMVYSNSSSGETLSFKFYDSGSGTTYDITETQEFTSDMIIGSAMVPFEMTALSSGNNAPTVDNPISDQALSEGFSSTTIDISSVFSDPDGDALSYSVSSGNTGVVNASLSGTTLTITEVSNGSTTITVTASDGTVSTDDEFDVTVSAVNQSPVLDNPLSDASYNEGFGTDDISLVAVFSDPDGDALTLTAISSNTSVATVSVSGTTLTLTEVGIGSTTVTVTASDGSLATDDSFTVSIADITDPVISTCAAGRTLEVASNCEASVPDLTVEISASDNHDTALDIVQSPLAGSAIGLGITEVTITVTDDAGNTASCAVDLNVVDNTDPVITAPGAIIIDADAGVCTASGVSLGTPTSSDNCSVASTTNNAPTTYPLGITTVTWTVTDGSGNTATATQTVTVVDSEDPTIIAPADLAIEADAGQCTASSVSLGSPSTGDNCSVSGTSNNAPASFPIGSTTVTWTVTDGSGNTATATQTVVVTENIDPTIAAPADLTIGTDSDQCSASGVDLGTPTTNDNCSVASTTNNAPASFSLGTTTVTWTVTDVSGNTATATQSVTVVDNEDPKITAPDPLAVSTVTGSCITSSVSLGSPTTSDNCSVSSTSNNAPAIYPLGETIVTWTVTDASGNSATATQSVIVTDDEDPTITAPGDISVSADAGVCSASSVNLGSATTDDNCSVASVTNNAPATFPLGSTTVTWTVTDGSGNTATDIQIVTVTDDEDPTIVAPADLTLNVGTGGCTVASPALGTPATDDNCSVAGVTNDAPATFPLGNTTVEWTVTDGSGNTASALQTVTVVDNEDPTIIAPADLIVPADAGTCTRSSVSLGSASSNDNCTVASVKNNAPASYPLGSTTVTWTVTDGSGNTATATQTVSVVDEEDPTITAPADITVSAEDGSCSAGSVALGSATTNDNCSVANTSNNAPSVFPIGSTTVTWTVTDGAGNTATATQTVNVVDEEDPIIVTCATDRNIDGDINNEAIMPDLLSEVNASDNCGVASITQNPASGTTLATGATNVLITVTDNSGNSVTCNSTITVIDVNFAPVVETPVSDVNYNEGFTAETIDLGSVFSDPDGDDLTITAGSSHTEVVTVSVSGTTLTITEVGNGTSTITLTATDGSLSTDDQFVVTVNGENHAPTVANPVSDTEYNEGFSSAQIDISSVFTDVDGDALSYEVTSSNTGVVTVSISGTNIDITEVGNGTSDITLTASDGSLAASDLFVITVNNVNEAPVVDTPIDDILLDEGFTTHVVQIAGVFSDPDDDVLSYSVVSSADTVVSVSLSGTELTISEVDTGYAVITLTASDGALSVTEEFTVTVDGDVGIAHEVFIDLHVYPVPSDGMVTMEAEYKSNEDLQIEVHNSLGQIIQQKTVTTSGSHLKETLDLSKCEAGLYFIKLTNSEINQTLKIIIK